MVEGVACSVITLASEESWLGPDPERCVRSGSCCSADPGVVSLAGVG